MKDDVGDGDTIENHTDLHNGINGDINIKEELHKGGINNTEKFVNRLYVNEEGGNDTMDDPEFVNMALDKIGDGELDVFGETEPVIVRKSYSNPELRGLGDGREGGYEDDGPRELTEDEYQEFLEDSECLVEGEDVEPIPQGVDTLPIVVENESALKKLAPNMGDISPLDEYPPMGGFPQMSDPSVLGGPDCLSMGSDIDEPREGSPEPDACFPPHAPEYLDPPSSDDEELMPADTADSVENRLDDSVEREAVVELRSKSKNKVIIGS